jgi:O-antigen/teichoic acid export membrane protein
MTHVPTPEEHHPVKTAGSRIAAFIRSFTKVIFVAMGMAVVGLILRVSDVATGNYLFVFAMAVLALLFLVQIGLSFFYVIANVRLALLGSICSIALVLGFTALIFRYQDWYGWQITFFTVLPLFVVTAYFLYKYFKKRDILKKQHRRFLYQNLITPYIFIFLLGLISIIFNNSLFNRQSHYLQQDSTIDQREKSDSSGMWRAY